MPASHDGSAAFTFELRFSEEMPLSYKTLRDHAFTVTGGEVVKARRLERGKNVRWEITVRPDGDGTVTIVLPATEDCASNHAICTGGRQAALQPASNRCPRTGGIRLAGIFQTTKKPAHMDVWQSRTRP